jgi:hypothetical protein
MVLPLPLGGGVEGEDLPASLPGFLEEARVEAEGEEVVGERVQLDLRGREGGREGGRAGGA